MSWITGVHFPAEAGVCLFSTAYRPALGTHLSFCPVGPKVSYHRGKTAEARSWPLTSI